MYKCTICPAEFKTAQGLANHKCRWVCGECGKKLTTPDEYGKHLKRHESAKKREETKRLKALEEQARYQEQRENKRKELDAKYQKLLDLGLFNPLYNQGDTVIVSSYIVTKPEFEMRRGRAVRVRYNEVREYDVFDMVVDRVLLPSVYDMWRVDLCIDKNEKYPIEYLMEKGKKIAEVNIFKDKKEAKEHSLKEAEKYRKLREEAYRNH